MQSGGTASSVSNPYSFETDPVFYAEYRSGSRVLITEKINKNKNLQQKKLPFLLKSKTTIYLSLGLQKGRLSYGRSLQPSENIQHLKTFLNFILGHFCPPGSGTGSTDLIESRPNPDPEH
jgi:hypothetical protein